MVRHHLGDGANEFSDSIRYFLLHTGKPNTRVEDIFIVNAELLISRRCSVHVDEKLFVCTAVSWLHRSDYGIPHVFYSIHIAHGPGALGAYITETHCTRRYSQGLCSFVF